MCARNGCLYYMPMTAKQVLRFDPVDESRQLIGPDLGEHRDRRWACGAILGKDGNIYAPKKLKSFTDRHTGERKTMEITKKIKEWYWTNDTGKISLYVKYGSKLLSLNKKGNNAIECANTDDLIETLTTLKKIVANGELDDAITSISKATRLGFGK